MCNLCFVMAMTSIRSRMEQLKKSIVEFGGIMAIHRNPCVLPNKAKVSTTRKCFDPFFKKISCLQCTTTYAKD